eukprot:gene17850-9956_t
MAQHCREMLLPLLLASTATAVRATPPLVFCCAVDNDLYQATLKAKSQTATAMATASASKPPSLSIPSVLRYGNCTEAVRIGANAGGAVLLLSEDAGQAHVQPQQQQQQQPPSITPYMMQMLAQHTFRLYAEQATIQPAEKDSMANDELASMDLTPCPQFARFVAVPGSALWSALPEDLNITLAPLEVLEPNECTHVPYIPVKGAGIVTHGALVKVAGFDKAVFGFNATDAPLPLLFQPNSHPGLMLSALRLSGVVSGRLSPTPSYARLWRRLLRWLQFDDANSSVDRQEAVASVWTDAVTFVPSVAPAYAEHAALPATAVADAVRAGVRWLHTTSGLLVESKEVYTSSAVLLDGVKPATCDAYLSGIDATRNNGAQDLGMNVRTDCVAESAGALAVGAWKTFADSKAVETSKELLDFLFFTSSAQQGVLRGGNPKMSSVAGILLWGTNVPAPHSESLYSDDQYRSLLSAAFAASALNSTRWNVPIARLLLGNARLIGPNGYTQWLGDQQYLAVQNGWQHYFNNDPKQVDEIQFYQAAGRAGNLWGFKVSGNQTLFFDRTFKGIGMSMAAFYKKAWTPQVGLTSALSRMLLPLAWLIRVHNTAETRKWLRDVVEMLATYIVPSGAIQEDPFGFNGASSFHHPPTTNVGYGTQESTLSQDASNPVCDLLYSFNFALFGMHEAAAATAGTSAGGGSSSAGGGGVGGGGGDGESVNDDHMLYATIAAKMAAFAVRQV